MFNKFFLVLCLMMVFLLPQKSNAATLTLAPSVSSITVGNIVSISVKVNTQGKYINNGEAVIQFPTDLLEVVSISKNSSIFSLWVEEPSFQISGRITFNGGVRTQVLMVALVRLLLTFKAKKAGSASVIYGDASIRENDGLQNKSFNF